MPIWGMDTTMIATLDKQINELMECKPLTESEGLRASRFQEPRANAGSSLT